MPVPSLPVFGTDNPPVASTTACASIPPRVVSTRQPVDVGAGRQRRVPLKLNAASPCQLDQPVAHVPRATREREQLSRLLLERERNAHVAFEELALCDEGPRPQHPAEEMCGGIGDESVGFERDRENVAPAAAADQDLAPAVGSSAR